MATKKITDLQLIDEVTVDLNFPADDGVQTYRVTIQQLLDFIAPLFNKGIGLLKNVSISASASAGALTVAMKQSDGTSDPATGIQETQVGMRSNTLTSGAQQVVSFSSALSLVIPSGATLGFKNSDDALVFVYAYYDGTNKGLAVSPKKVDESLLYSLSAIGTGSDSNGIYADANRTNAALRLIGEVGISAIATAGTWTTPTFVSNFSTAAFRRGYLKTTVFTSSGTYTKNPYADLIEVELVGGGGGAGGAASSASGATAAAAGAGAGGYSRKTIQNTSVGDTETVTIGAGGNGGAAGNNNGTDGGTTSFGSHLQATGGAGSAGSASTSGSGGNSGANGGVGSGGDVNVAGASGGGVRIVAGGTNTWTGYGGNSFFGGGGRQTSGSAGEAGQSYGAGGGGGNSNASGSAVAGGAGKAGIVIVREYKF